jgi:hypothetical protein
VGSGNELHVDLPLSMLRGCLLMIDDKGLVCYFAFLERNDDAIDFMVE